MVKRFKSEAAEAAAVGDWLKERLRQEIPRRRWRSLSDRTDNLAALVRRVTASHVSLSSPSLLAACESVAVASAPSTETTIITASTPAVPQ